MNITIKYGTGNILSRNNIPNGTTIGTLIADPSIRGGLGYGTNVEGYIGGIPQSPSIELADGDVLEVHDKACQKAADGALISVTVRYGTGNQLRRSYPQGTTIGNVINSARGTLAYGANVEGYLNGIPQNPAIALVNGDILEIHDKACQKAAGGVSVTITYGTGNVLTREFPVGSTIGSVLSNSGVRGGLGYGTNVEGYLSGVPQNPSIVLANGDVLEVHDKACQKAARKAAVVSAPAPKGSKGANKPAPMGSVKSGKKGK